ncbi:MAG: hypothetical protein QNJ98_03545 [Planctomycetota bacterium]|nr:hypothetical protein [Planctomycetota bacterium]
MPLRSPRSQSGIVVLILLYAGSAAALALGALAGPASDARDASARMARHATLAPLAAELDALADQADGLAQEPAAAGKGGPGVLSHGPTLGLIILANTQQRLDALEMRMLRASSQLDAEGRADLVEGIVALHALRGAAAAAEKELLILITPTIVTPTAEAKSANWYHLAGHEFIWAAGPQRVAIPQGGTVLIGGLTAR